MVVVLWKACSSAKALFFLWDFWFGVGLRWLWLGQRRLTLPRDRVCQANATQVAARIAQELLGKIWEKLKVNAPPNASPHQHRTVCRPPRYRQKRGQTRERGAACAAIDTATSQLRWTTVQKKRAPYVPEKKSIISVPELRRFELVRDVTYRQG